MKVISGGQTGVDQAGLRAARACGIETGGWAPKGWLTEEGAAPWLADYGLVEHESSEYPPRTADNVFDAHGTLLFGDPWTKGSICTLKAVMAFGRPVILIDNDYAGKQVEMRTIQSRGKKYETFLVHKENPEKVLWWLNTSCIQILNVAGNRESSNPGVGAAAEMFLVEVFRKWKEQAK